MKVILGNHTTKIGSGQTPIGGNRSYHDVGVPFIRSQNVLMGSFNKNGLAFISSEQDDQMQGSRVFPGDVLLNITGASIGRVCVVPEEICPANVNQHVCIIRCDNSIDSQYLATYLANPKFQAFIWQSQAGGTRQALTKEMIESFEVPLLEVNDQRRIASQLKAQLAAVEEARSAAQAQLTEATFLATRLKEQALTKLDGIARVSLGRLLNGIEAGKSFQTTDRLATDTELGVLKVSAVSWNCFQPQEAKSIEENYVPQDHHRVYRGDLLISRANTVDLVGAVVRVNQDYPNRLLSDKTLRLLIDETQVLPEFLLHILRMPEARKHIEGKATGTSDSMRNISQETIRAIPVVLPGIEAQRKIAAHLEQVDTALNELSQSVKSQLRDINLLPAKILAKAFDFND